MPVQVQVPVTVRLPHGSALAPTELADLEVGTGDALLRALDTVCEEVLVPRSRERVVRLADPTFRYSTALDERMRADLQLAMERAVESAVVRSGLRAWYRPGGPVAALSGRPVAWLDPSRRSDDGYSIQFFDDGTRGTVTLGEPEIVDAPAEPAGPLTAEDAAYLAWEAHLQRFGPLWDPAAYGYPGYYGSFVYNGTLLDQSLLYIYRVESLDEQGWPDGARWQIGSFAMLRYAEEKDEIVRGALRPAMGHWVMTRTETPTNYDNILRRYDERDAQRPEAERLSPEVRQRMARIVSDYATAKAGAAIWTVEDGQTSLDVMLPPASEGSWGIAHSPVRFIAQQQLPGTETAAEGAGGQQEGAGRGEEAGEGGERGEGGEGAGGGRRDGRPGGRGTRPRGGPLGTGVGHGTVWPTLGIGGEPLVCEPFLGEPPLDQLVVGADALRAEMQELAATLDVEYCGYAGKLCINLAKLIGARAHAIGVTSITSTITTAVQSRPDGGGNHGFVDIRPGSSPELGYMEALGDLVVRVHNLANTISRTYLAGPNQHLIYWDADREFDPDAAAWSLRFWGEMSDALPNACMWLFAESCRVILLQQLRSSHSGIVARQEQFTETHRRFNEALGILGESVVKLSVLKQAIAYADRYRLSGSVRSVLSHRPPRRYMGHGEYYEPPAPIESMASQVVALLADATIEQEGDHRIARYDNRVWTTSDLEQGIGLRRSVLNMVDPLFFQVPDLDLLFHQFRMDPSSSETYLRRLLGQMREANEGMTREASDWEDGAFFALEASQWVAAEGGINSLGLHYDLHGIHKLADDVLRPWVGSVAVYNEGVDKAISIKANWDRFLQIFAVAGIIVLALLCAPLGAVVVGVVTGVAGLALTLHDIAEADRMEALYRSLEDPEAILAWQDVELARLMANLSIAFSIFDVVGVGKGAKAIVAGARTALREVAEQGVRATVRASLQSARRTILRNMAEEVLRNAVREAIQQAVIAGTMQAVLPVVITPVLVPWIRGVALEHGTLGQVDQVLGDLGAGQPALPVAVSSALPSDIALPDEEPVGPDDESGAPVGVDAGTTFDVPDAGATQGAAPGQEAAQ